MFVRNPPKGRGPLVTIARYGASVIASKAVEARIRPRLVPGGIEHLHVRASDGDSQRNVLR